MANIKRANASGITKTGSAISDVPDAPTIGAVADTAAGGTVTVAYTAAVTGGAVTTFTATSTPGSLTGTGASPITVTGLTDNTAYTFKVKGTNSTATGPESAASASVTPTLPPLSAYDSIATVNVGSGGTSSVTFTSIPATYKHLQIRGIYRNPGAVVYLNVTTSSGVNYGLKKHYLSGGNGNNVYSNSEAPSASNGLNLDVYVGALVTNQFGAFVLDILDYADTNKYKTIRYLGGYDDASSTINLISGFYDTTNAITALEFKGSTPQYSSFALYGIKGA